MPGSFTNLAAATGQQRMASMNLGSMPQVAAPQQAMAAVDPNFVGVGGSGVSRATDKETIAREVLGYGYIAGYIMQNAPQITLSLAKKERKDGVISYSITAKESKPSRILGVLMALPKRCVCIGDSLAEPSDIIEGRVDYNVISQEEMVYQSFSLDATKAYIGALGGRIPEYAPHVVPGAKEQWPAASIWGEDSRVSFVYVAASGRRSKKSSADGFNFVLKTSSSRRTLFTPRNHVCLRALEHISTECKTEEDAYYLNESAFGSWRFRFPGDDKESVLEKAQRECPDIVWKKKYNINGKEIEGVGSVFFMAGNTETPEGSSAPIMKRELQCFRWNQTGSGTNRGVPEKVPSIVKRTFQAGDGNRKDRMVNKPIYYKDDHNNKVFDSYSRFVKYIFERGYLTPQALDAMGTRTVRATTKTRELTPDQLQQLQNWMRTKNVASSIAMSRQQYRERALINERGSKAI